MRRFAVAAAILIGIVLAVRWAIDPLAHYYTRRGLDRMERFEGTFSDVSFSVFALSYSIEDLVIREKLAKEGDPEIFAADEIHARVLWRNLLHGEVIGLGRIEGARTRIVLVPGEEPKERAAEELVEEPPKPWVLDDAVQSLIPFRLERLEVRDGNVVIVAGGSPHRPELHFPHVEASLENFTSRRAVVDAQPLTVALQSRLQNSGRLKLFLTADLLADEATFSCQAKLIGLELHEVRDFLAATTDGIEVPDGELELFASFDCVGGILEGAIKPILKHAEVDAVGDDLLDRLEALVLDLGVQLLSDRVPQREAAAAVIPIEGKITAPGIETWSTIVSLLRNAFIEGLSASFKDLAAGRAGDAGQEGG